MSILQLCHFIRENSPVRDRIPSITLVIFAVVATQANACSIPVFRYALENWQPDPYVAFVLHRDELTAEQQSLIDTMRSQKFAGTTSANLVVKTVNLDTEQQDEFLQKLREESGGRKLPCLVVQKPAKRDTPETVFSGELTPTIVARLIDSPVRMNIKDRLLNGDSVVWVYLECGRKQKDDQTFSLLTQELSRLQNELKLPEIEDEDLSELTAVPESLKIRFSAVRLSRDDAQEVAFRDMLLHVEHDLRDEAYVNQPMAFPVFGRGRVLYALVGDGLAPDLIEEACRFLTGGCQCTVKAENPGVDLLMQVEWDNFIRTMGTMGTVEAMNASMPPLAGFTGFGQVAEGSSTGIQLSQNTISQEEKSVPSPSKPDSVVDLLQATAADAQAVNPHNEIDAKSSSASVVSQNVIYVVLFAGCVVVVATSFLIRRSGG